MNLDFHYYATMVAACFAGFSKDEADVIANAAQYVDEHCADNIQRQSLIELGVEPRTTCMQMTEYEKYYVKLNFASWTDAELCELQGIWIPFHFLPGNLHNEIPYEGNDTYKNNGALMNRFRLLCNSNSELVSVCMNKTIENYRETKNLCRVGLMMHVLADTWAHKYYLGRPEKYTNNITNAKVKQGDAWKNVTYSGDDNPGKCEYTSFPVRMLTEQGISFLGHAQAGHMPDYSFLTYSYQAEWKSKGAAVIKDNPTDFMNAFTQMVYALKCIRQGSLFQLNTFDSMAEYQSYEADYQNAIKTIQTDASTSWMKLAGKVMGSMPYLYDRNYFTDEFKESTQKTNTEYYRFAIAARDHYHVVDDYLKTYGFSLEKNL